MHEDLKYSMHWLYELGKECSRNAIAIEDAIGSLTSFYKIINGSNGEVKSVEFNGKKIVINDDTKTIKPEEHPDVTFEDILQGVNGIQ